jgi:hypothetical protein
MKYVIVLAAILSIFAKCDTPKETVYPKNAIAFSQNFLIAIKTEQPYDLYRDTLRNIDLKQLQSELATADQKLAFWINTYNAMVQAKIRDDQKQFDDRDKFFKTEDQMIGGVELSLDQIENGIMRRQTVSSNKQFVEAFQVDRVDPRIHFTLNCGATSCPPVAYYSVENLDKDLSLAEASYVTQTSSYNAESNTLEISELFDWFEADFGGKKGVLEVMKRLEIIPQDADPKITYAPYNWNLDIDNF